MRRSAALALLLPALLLAGCGQEADVVGAGADTDLQALAAISVSGDLGAAPTVEFEPEIVLTDVAALLVSEGEGAAITAGQTITMHYALYAGDDPTSLGDSWQYSEPTTLVLGDEAYYPELNEILLGRNVGARVILGIPGFEGATAEESYPASLMIIEVTETAATREIPDRAEGAAVEPPAGLPVVTLAADGAPSIEIPADATEPVDLVVQPLIQGAGPAVEVGQTVTFHYSGWLWDGTSFDSSWSKGAPFTTQIGVGRLIDGWDSGLIGQTVGSQVLLVVPSDQGYGDAGSASIPGGATLIFVVDILDAV